MPDTPSLLFVYNLDSAVLQSLHDYSSSKTAPAGVDPSPLMTLTYSPLGIKKEWKRFLKELAVPSRSISRDEFVMEFGHLKVTFPVVLNQKGPALSILISTEEIQQCRDLSDLIALVRERLPLV